MSSSIPTVPNKITETQKCIKCTNQTNNCCKACRTAYYCSPQCQAADWSTHKPRCMEVRAMIIESVAQKEGTSISGGASTLLAEVLPEAAAIKLAKTSSKEIDVAVDAASLISKAGESADDFELRRNLHMLDNMLAMGMSINNRQPRTGEPSFILACRESPIFARALIIRGLEEGRSPQLDLHVTFEGTTARSVCTDPTLLAILISLGL